MVRIKVPIPTKLFYETQISTTMLTYTIIAIINNIIRLCHKRPGFVIVESNFNKNSKELVQFGDTASPRYQATFQKIKSVSLKPPSLVSI